MSTYIGSWANWKGKGGGGGWGGGRDIEVEETLHFPMNMAKTVFRPY